MKRRSKSSFFLTITHITHFACHRNHDVFPGHDSGQEFQDQIWATGASTAADVIRQLRATHDWNHSTIRTLLARLVEKGALTYEVHGSRYIYRSAVSREQCVRHESRSFLKKAFGGDVAALLTHFVKEASLDRDQIEQIRRLLAQKKKLYL